MLVCGCCEMLFEACEKKGCLGQIRIRDLMSLVSVWYAGSLVRKNSVVRITFHIRLHPVENLVTF